METTKQTGLQTLPNELLLSILEDGAFSFLELVRLGTTAPFRSLLQKPYRSLAECLFLRTLDDPVPSAEVFDNFTMRITAVVRKVPSTIWNDYSDLYELTWHLDTDDDTYGVLLGPLNPVLMQIEKYLDLVNPHFKHHSPCETSAPGTPQPPRSLRFRVLAEFKRLIGHEGDFTASVCNMCMSNFPLQSSEMLCSVGRRYHARAFFDAGDYLNSTVEPDKETRMKGFFEQARKVLRMTRRCLEEDGAGEIVPVRGDGVGKRELAVL